MERMRHRGIKGQRGGGVKAKEKLPALWAFTRGEGAGTTLLTGGVGGDHLSVTGEREWVGWAVRGAVG